MATLVEILSGSLSYDSSWGIYAERINGKFEPESPARFGQRIFENGGLLDDCEFFASNKRACDDRLNYCGSDDNAEEFYEEWALQFIDESNGGPSDDELAKAHKLLFGS